MPCSLKYTKSLAVRQADCHQMRQVIYIHDKMILHFLFVLEIKDLLNHCGWKHRPAQRSHVFLIALGLMWRGMMDI